MTDRTGLSALKGARLVASITSVCAPSFLLFGYDRGVISGVVIYEYWLEAMGHPSTVMTDTITALYDIGAVFGAIGAALTVERFRRKRGLLTGAALIVIGAILMGCCVERIQMIVGRIVTGLACSNIYGISFYKYRISHSHRPCIPKRDLFTQSTWMAFIMPTINNVVRINAGLLGQLRLLLSPRGCAMAVPYSVSSCLCDLYSRLCTLPTRHTTLAYVARGNAREGTYVLSKLRDKPTDDRMVQKEKNEILSAINIEAEEEGPWKSRFSDGGCPANKRFFLAVGIQFMQQTSGEISCSDWVRTLPDQTGINIVTYYAPTLLKSSLNMTQERGLFVSCFLQVWYIIASFLTWHMIDAVGRRRLYISMSLGMCVVLICEAATVAANNQRPAIAAVFFIFAFEACFTRGWMATVWVYLPSGNPPSKDSFKGICARSCSGLPWKLSVNRSDSPQVVKIAPPALENIGYKTYIIFAVFNLVTALIVWCLYPETSYLNLESVELLFLPDEARDQEIASEETFLQRSFQWSVVPRARMAVNEAKARQMAGLDLIAIDIEADDIPHGLKKELASDHVEFRE
ncbi:uncharacterized protein N7446_000837 [Penicillium canescens]|uniref:Major facilitator superfamily (MFS) profile domain-containing protein n=1 Tax=Penicillium canescens TaxID=5083 RepID=A0AAD6N539_PENCN|nr:uncharacterized protein N7446_000837 [Penicillium canescens]KAJ6030100.1 hypothetical protein N7460_010366 [Penicillium canescens]KAJ6060477.1 hypothetical protein N7444_002331 [Penicillium canescens]KAJ6077901.1 hypothetical protein N7446_000837 [Penicillium canescens]